MEYNLAITLEHPYASTYAHLLNELIQKDGGSGLFPDEIKAISLDGIERSFKKDRPDPTMDVALGVADKRNNAIVNKRMLLCEFRFNYKNPRNISKSDIEGKVNYSSALLKNNYEGQIDPKCYFLFSESVCQQAKYRFSRIYSGRTANRIVETERSFKDLLFK